MCSLSPTKTGPGGGGVIERRAESRVGYRRNVDVYSVRLGVTRRCQISNLCTGGMFVNGAGWMPPGEALRVTLDAPNDSSLVMDARVIHHRDDGVGVAFEHLSSEHKTLLGNMLTPSWSGDTLLDAVVGMAPWSRQTNLAGWMRLTSLAADWQRLTQATKKLS